MMPLDRKLGRDLWRLKGQVLTIALVVASGIGGFIGSLSTHASLVRLRDDYYESGRFAHVFVHAKRAPQRLQSELRAIPGVAGVETLIVGEVMITLPGVVDSMSGQVISLPQSGTPYINRLHLRSGRWLEPGDTAGVLVSEAFATSRGLAAGDPIGVLMNGKRETLWVRGVAMSPEFIFAAGHGGFSDDTRFGVLWMSSEKLAAAYDMRGAFNSAALRLTYNASLPAVLSQVDRVLAPFGSTGSYGRADQLSNRALTQEIAEQRVFGTVLPAVFMGVAVFLLNVLLSRHIATERPQIAALKALGYENWVIGLHYLKLVLVIVLLGAMLGIGIGIVFGRWMTQLYTGFFHFPRADYWLDAWIVSVSVGLALLAGLAAAIGIVRSVARLPPAEAMRPPAPTTFRRTLLERLGLGRLYSPATRMVLRELERRPWRTVLTIAGVASSVAIVIGGTWWGGAFDRLIEVELQIRERPDVMVSLTGPVNASARHDVARLPGVLSVDVARDVAVRFEHGAASYRTAIIGLDSSDGLRRVLDTQFRSIPLVEGGLVMTDRLADRLGLRLGDLVTVEPLEGRRERTRLRVAAFSGDLMGMQAYASRRTVARLLGEGDAITTLRLRLDRRSEQQFYRQVRDIPRFASIGDKNLLIAHFRETQARNLLVFTGILSVFAGFIAVGVVYNSARIALAEHSRELATLRVLGFTRGEVSQILLGQLAVPVAIAIPIGCLIGLGLAWLLTTLIQGTEFRIPLYVRSNTYALAVLVMLGASIVSGLIVRRRIDRLDLVAVLKTSE